MMTTTTTSTTILTTTAGTPRVVSPAGPLVPTSSSLNAKHLAIANLAELNDAAGLPTRMDHKYLMPLERVQEFVGSLSSEVQVPEIDGRRRFSHVSTYFDALGLKTFMPTACKRRWRSKVHTYTYLGSSLCLLKTGIRGVRGTTVKRRMGYHPNDASRLTGPGHAFVAAYLANARVASPAAIWDVTATLRPVLTTTYEHTIPHLPRVEARATINMALIWQRPTPGGRTRTTAVTGAPQALRLIHSTAAIDDGEPVTVAGVATVETENPATPPPADRALWDTGHRPTHISKYAVGMALFHPELPANRRYRALTHGLTDLLDTSHSSLESIDAMCASASTT